MSTPHRFTNELARLVWLLVYRPSHVDEQKRALRTLLSAAKDSAHLVKQSEVAARVTALTGARPTPEELPWLAELATRMQVHAVRGIEAFAGAKAPDLLGVARTLAAPEDPADRDAAFDRAVVSLGLTTMAVHLGGDGFVRTPTPIQGMPAVGARPALTPTSGVSTVDDTLPRGIPVVGGTTGGSRPTPTSTMIQQDLMPALDASDLVIRLRGDLSAETAPALLDEMSRNLEDHARRGEWVELLDLATRVMEREHALTSPELKRAFAIHLKRLSKPGILRGIAQLLPRHKDRREGAQAFLDRQGDAAADMLIDLLVSSESATERRAYRDAIRRSPSAVEPLTHLLRDPRWFVVRNAAELLGEMMAVDADQELINVLRHRDARVRHAATMSLIRLGTPRAVHTIIRSLTDEDPSVRLKAALGLGRISNPRAAAALLEALDREEDEAVQHALLAALGNHPTDEVVPRLVKEAGPGPLLKRRPVARRLAAVQALGSAATHAARTALRELLRDRDKVVREAADKALAEHDQESVATHH